MLPGSITCELFRYGKLIPLAIAINSFMGRDATQMEGSPFNSGGLLGRHFSVRFQPRSFVWEHRPRFTKPAVETLLRTGHLTYGARRARDRAASVAIGFSAMEGFGRVVRSATLRSCAWPIPAIPRSSACTDFVMNGAHAILGQ